MQQAFPPVARRVTLTGALCALALLASSSAALGGSQRREEPPQRHQSAPHRLDGVRARAASSYLTGIGNEQVSMFASPYWQRLHTKIVRYIVPYDAVHHAYWLDLAISFIRTAEQTHQRVLVAFYHSEISPTRMPSVSTYKADVQAFVKRFPYIREYQSWDEANRGNEPHRFSSPNPVLDAKYYQALLRVCKGCTVVGLDVLDQQFIQPTLQYIAEFKREIYRLETIMPTVWGLHDYSDVNRFESWRTRDIVKAFGGGQVWLTETGGIVKFGTGFPNVRGSGLRRAARVLRYTFGVAGSIAQIKRLYIYDWTGGTARTVFDAGLMNTHGQPREGYVVVCQQLRAAGCNHIRTVGN